MSPDTVLTVGVCSTFLAFLGWIIYHISLAREIKKSRKDLKNLQETIRARSIIHALTSAQVELILQGKCPDCGTSELWTTAKAGFSSTAQCGTCGSKFRIISPIERVL